MSNKVRSELNHKGEKITVIKEDYLLYAIGHSKNSPGHHSKSTVRENFDIKVFTNSRIQFHALKNVKAILHL